MKSVVLFPSLRRFFFGPDNPWLNFTLYSAHRDSWGCGGAKCTDFYGYPFLIFIYVFLSVLGLRFWVAFFSHCAKREPLWLQRAGSSLPWLLLSWSMGSRVHGLGCSAACGIVPDEGSNPRLLHWGWVLYCWATRGALNACSGHLTPRWSFGSLSKHFSVLCFSCMCTSFRLSFTCNLTILALCALSSDSVFSFGPWSHMPWVIV